MEQRYQHQADFFFSKHYCPSSGKLSSELFDNPCISIFISILVLQIYKYRKLLFYRFKSILINRLLTKIITQLSMLYQAHKVPVLNTEHH